MYTHASSTLGQFGRAFLLIFTVFQRDLAAPIPYSEDAQTFLRPLRLSATQRCADYRGRLARNAFISSITWLSFDLKMKWSAWSSLTTLACGIAA